MPYFALGDLSVQSHSHVQTPINFAECASVTVYIPMNIKSYMANPAAILELTLMDPKKGQIQGHSILQALIC